MKRRTFLAASTLVVAGCAETAPEADDDAPPPDSDEWEIRRDVDGSITNDAHQNLVVPDHDFAVTGDHARVRGTVQNTRDSAFPGVEIEVTLYSGEDESLASGNREREEDLEPEETWEFSVVIEDVDVEAVDRYEMTTGGESPL